MLSALLGPALGREGEYVRGVAERRRSPSEPGHVKMTCPVCVMVLTAAERLC